MTHTIQMRYVFFFTKKGNKHLFKYSYDNSDMAYTSYNKLAKDLDITFLSERIFEMPRAYKDNVSIRWRRDT